MKVDSTKNNNLSYPTSIKVTESKIKTFLQRKLHVHRNNINTNSTKNSSRELHPNILHKT